MNSDRARPTMTLEQFVDAAVHEYRVSTADERIETREGAADDGLRNFIQQVAEHLLTLG